MKRQPTSSSTSYRHGPWRNCVVTGSRERDKDSLSWLHDCQMKKKRKRKDHRRRLSNKWEVNELNLKITIKVRHANIKERNGPWSSTETGYGHATLPIIRGPAHKFTAAAVVAHRVAQFRTVARPNDNVSPEFGMLVDSTLRSPHGQQPGQNVNEHATDPRGHAMRLRRSKVNVQHHDSHANTNRKKKRPGWKEKWIKFIPCGKEEKDKVCPPRGLVSPDGNENHGEN